MKLVFDAQNSLHYSGEMGQKKRCFLKFTHVPSTTTRKFYNYLASIDFLASSLAPLYQVEITEMDALQRQMKKVDILKDLEIIM